MYNGIYTSNTFNCLTQTMNGDTSSQVLILNAFCLLLENETKYVKNELFKI